MLNETRNNAIFLEILQENGFHTLNLMNSTYPSTIWDKSSASYARVLAKNSVSVSDPVNILPTANLLSIQVA
jgi:hypothetical protein